MKTTDITRRELATLKMNNTREMTALREWMKEIEGQEENDRKYLHGEPVFLQRLWCERDMDTCKFRVKKYARMTEQMKS